MSAAVTVPGALLREPHLDLGRLAVEAADQALEVEDDVGDVLADARERRELVRDALDLDRGHGGALERREQHAAQRVAERVAEAAVERLDHEDAAVLVDVLVDDLRDLEFHQASASCHACPSLLPSPAGSLGLLGVELDDELLLHRRVDLGPLGQLQDLAGQAVVVGLEPGGDGRGEVGRVADDLLGRASPASS